MAIPQAAKPNPAQVNMAARQMLLQSGLAFTKLLPGISQGNPILGQSVRIPLDRTGIVTGVTLLVQVPMNITAAATQSPFGPYPIVSNIQYTDFSGVVHINCTGWQLHFLNSIKAQRAIGNSAKNAGYITGSETGVDTNLLALPVAVANPTSAYFALYVPLAYHARGDLRGAILAQTDRGEHYLTVTFANALVNADPFAAPFTAGTAVLASNIVVNAFMHYLMPQGGVGPNNIPMIDLSTIYEIQGNLFDNTNIVAGQPKYSNWPNNRAILSSTHFYDQAGAGGTLNGADIAKITMLVNGNTHLRELTPQLLRLQMRDMMGYDFPSGVYYLPSRTQPVTTQLFGNVQTQFDITTAGAGSYFQSMYESTFLSGTPLPGVIQP
ncbi:MAG: hypothetical protein ACRD22_00570 [Terriglobia bacterium]